jgi:hypothetical protein
VPDATAQEAADTKESRPARGLHILIALLVSIILPAAIYAIYVLGQLEHIREHNLRGLESTAQAVSELLDNTRTTVGNLRKDARYACTFFQRQTRARLVTPTCDDLASEGRDGIDPAELQFDVSRGAVDIVGKLKSGNSFRIEVQVSTLLEQVPFGSVFDRLMIVDNSGKLLSSAITPQRSSPMLPPGVAAPRDASPPVRVLNLAELKFVDSTKDTPIKFGALGQSTLVQPVILGGVRYTLICQPWRIANVGGSGPQTWRLCGFIDGQRAFQQALDVAPQFIILLLVLFTLAVISWPVLKILSIAPRERIRFADMFLMLLATLALVMVLSIAVADLGTYAQLRQRSQTRLEHLAGDIETHLREEFTQMREELRRYDRAIADSPSIATAVLKSDDAKLATRVACLLLPSKTADAPASGGACLRAGLLEDLLTPPTRYRDFQNVFWMRPCNGLQFIKGTVLSQITPAIETSGREYFEAVKHDRLWPVWPAGANGSERGEPSDKFFVDTSASVTTGEFFAALSIESAIKSDAADSSADCKADEAKRFAAAMSGRPESFNYPILAPGIGFAVINEAGRVLFHSDQRRAMFENLFDDEGLADRLRAALAARSDASFHAHYQTRPHQVHVHLLRDIPWAIVTFADDEILRTQHIEMLAQTAILITLYLLLAVLGTLLYIFVHGREPPLWVWPRREEKYRVLYAGTVWTLGAQLILSLLAVDVLRGEVLALACLLLPLPGVLTIVVAARQARLLRAPPRDGMTADAHCAEVVGRFRRRMALLLALAIALLLGLVALMKRYYPVAAAQIDTGIETAGLVILLAIVIAAGAIGERIKGRPRSREAGPVIPLVRWWRDPLRPHIVASVIVWLVLGALPAYGMYKFALANEMAVMAMNEHAYLGRAFAWRACRMEDDAQKIPTADSSAPQQGPTSTQPSVDSTVTYQGIYLRALLSRDVQVTAEQANYKPVSDRAVGHYFWRYIANLAPVYNETTTYSRYFEPTVPAENAEFTWVKTASDGARPMLLYRHDGAGTCDRSVRYVASRPPMLEPHFDWLGVLVALGFVPVLFAWATFAARRLFFGDIEVEARRTHDAGEDLPRVVHPERLDLPPDLAWAKTEVAPIFDPYLRFSDDMLKELCARSTTRRTVADSILEQERAFYAAEWRECNAEEKLLLTQLVQEGFANPRQNEIVRKLLKRGLIRRDPVLRPMNNSFALFVENQAQPEDIRHLESVHRGMRWSLVRNVLIGAGLLILIFLSVTQRDVVEVWVAYLGTAAAGAGGVLKLFSMLGRSGSQKAT